MSTELGSREKRYFLAGKRGKRKEEERKGGKKEREKGEKGREEKKRRERRSIITSKHMTSMDIDTISRNSV